MAEAHPLTSWLVRSKAFDGSPVRVVDLGAAGGAESHWQIYRDQLDLLGFEPDEAECRRLNQQGLDPSTHGRRTYFPVALHEDSGPRTFYLTERVTCSSFLRPNEALLARFPEAGDLRVVGEARLASRDLDSLLDEHRVPAVDFIKLDIQGAELAAMKGARKTLGRTLGVSVEVEFFPIYQNQPLFGQVDEFLRSLGFSLFDLSSCRWRRKALPEMIQGLPPSLRTGQIAWAQALYFRDAVADPEFATWDRLRILKLSSFLEISGLADCALELLQAARGRQIPEDESARLQALLGPGPGGADGRQKELESWQGRARLLGRIKELLKRGLPRQVRVRLRRWLEAILAAS